MSTYTHHLTLMFRQRQCDGGPTDRADGLTRQSRPQPLQLGSITPTKKRIFKECFPACNEHDCYDCVSISFRAVNYHTI